MMQVRIRGTADEVRLGLLTEWVTADPVDEVLAERGVRDQRPGALPAGSWSITCLLLPCSCKVVPPREPRGERRYLTRALVATMNGPWEDRFPASG